MSRLILPVIVLAFVTGCGGSGLTIMRGETMGTTYTVKVVEEEVDKEAVQEDIDAGLARINDLMSTYIPDSELSRLNRAPVGEWFEISPDTMAVIELSKRIHELSDGSFDVTVGPLVNLWGFGPDPSSREVPSDQALAEARARVGFDLLSIGEGAVRKEAAVYVDLSAIAKGYGVDRVADILEARGFRNYLVEIGGELRARGVNERGTPWRIAIEVPEGMGRSVFRTLDVQDCGMATSGDYRNYFEVDGRRYSHTIDPSTGRPVTHDLASVTVLADTAALADGMATAINVMGAERGLALAEEQNLAVQVIIKADNRFEERTSAAFEEYVSGEAESG